jgi:hypothetical protein
MPLPWVDSMGVDKTFADELLPAPLMYPFQGLRDLPPSLEAANHDLRPEFRPKDQQTVTSTEKFCYILYSTIS